MKAYALSIFPIYFSVTIFKKYDFWLLNITPPAPGGGGGGVLKVPRFQGQFEGIWLIHLPDLLFDNFLGKAKVSLFQRHVSSKAVSSKAATTAKAAEEEWRPPRRRSEGRSLSRVAARRGGAKPALSLSLKSALSLSSPFSLSQVSVGYGMLCDGWGSGAGQILFLLLLYFCAAASGPQTDPRPTRDPPVTHLASSASIQMIITRPSEALRSSSFVCPIQVDRPGTRETVPEAVAPL